MAKTVVRRDSHFPEPDPPDHLAFRTFGDGYAGDLVAARIQGYSSADLAYVDVAVDSNGNLKLAANVTVDIGVVDQGAAGASAWKVDGSAVTQPVSATALPLPSGAAKDSTLTDGTQRVGGSVAVTQSTSPWVTSRNWTLASGTDSVNVGNFPATQAVSIASMPSTPVTGTFWQATQPVSAAALPLPTGASLELGGMLQQQTELLQQLLIETRIQSFQLSQGLNVYDDLAALRSDPSYLN